MAEAKEEKPEPKPSDELAAVVKKRGWLRGNSSWVRPTHDALRARYGTRPSPAGFQPSPSGYGGRDGGQARKEES